jgi:hypothetical protein
LAAFFVKFTFMIPYYLEQLIHQGKGEHKTFSGAMAENLILKVPDKSYIVIYEYWYKPLLPNLGASEGTDYNFQLAMQFVNFYNSNGYNVYWHEVHTDLQVKNEANLPYTNPANTNSPYQMPTGDHTDYRSLYLKTDRDLSIYFTMLNQDTVTSAVAVAPQFDPLNNYFGYSGNNIMTGAQGYQNLVATAQTYTPLASPITNVVAPTFTQDFTNAIFSFAAGSGGFFPPFSAYGEAGNSAMGKARAHHFQCNYVLISEESPKNFR